MLGELEYATRAHHVAADAGRIALLGAHITRERYLDYLVRTYALEAPIEARWAEVEGLAAVGQLDAADLEGVVSGPILNLAGSLVEVPPDGLPDLLRERLSEGERALFERAGRPDAPVAEAADCVVAIKRDRVKRDLAAVQEEIDRVAAESEGHAKIDALWAKKKALLSALDTN